MEWLNTLTYFSLNFKLRPIKYVKQLMKLHVTQVGYFRLLH